MYLYKSGLPVTGRSGAILYKPIPRERWELNNDDVLLLDKIGRVRIPSPKRPFLIQISSGKLRRRLPGAAEEQQPGGRRQNVPRHSAGGAQEEIPAGRQDTQTVRPSEHSQTHRDLRPKAADHDRHGVGTRFVTWVYLFIFLCWDM